MGDSVAEREPRALVVEDQEAHALIARKLLGQAGFGELVVSRSLRDGLAQARRLLDRTLPAWPTLLLLDWQLPAAGTPSLEATVLAAELTRAMDEEELHPAPLVAVTYYPSPEREQDALEAGCALVLTKPLDTAKVQRLRALVERGPAVPISALQRVAYQRILRHSRSTLELLASYSGAETPATWDAKTVKWLLKALIPQDLEEPWRSWVLQRGGLARVVAYLRDLPVEERDLRTLRDLLLARPAEEWQSYAAAMAMSKTVFFELRRRLFALLAQALNGWQP